MKNYIGLFVLLIGLNGCGWFWKDVKKEDEITAYTAPVQRSQLNLPDPQPLKLLPFSFFTVTPDNSSEVFNILRRTGKEQTIIGVTTDDYEHLSKNMKMIENFYILQKDIIKQMRDYYEPKTSPTK